MYIMVCSITQLPAAAAAAAAACARVRVHGFVKQQRASPLSYDECILCKTGCTSLQNAPLLHCRTRSSYAILSSLSIGAAKATLLRERTPSAPRMPPLLLLPLVPALAAAALMLPLRCTRGSTRCSISCAEAVADASAASASWLGKHLRIIVHSATMQSVHLCSVAVYALRMQCERVAACVLRNIMSASTTVLPFTQTVHYCLHASRNAGASACTSHKQNQLQLQQCARKHHNFNLLK
jgi:hypothetical protein